MMCTLHQILLGWTRVRGAGRVACKDEDKNAYRVLVGKHETSTLDGVGGQRHAPAALPLGKKDPVPIV